MEHQKTLPDVLYHYTSMDVLLKIVELNQIWATNIRYLNDSSEREYCLALVRNRLKYLDGREGSEAIPEEEADLNERNSMDLLPFVTSFSTIRDDLSQWRSYCPSGNGVCIGFRTESLMDAFPVSNDHKEIKRSFGSWIELAPVRYLALTDVSAVEEIIFDAIRVSQNWLKENPEWATEQIRSTIFWHAIEASASSVKHPAFRAENEYRLLTGTTEGFIDSMRFRTSFSTLIPYVALELKDPEEFLPGVGHLEPIFEFPDLPKPYSIDNVTIGPTPHPNLTQDSVNSLFGRKNRDVVVHVSVIPYRDW